MPILNLPQFETALAAEAALTEQQFNQIARKVALQALDGVVFGTRVKTGRARGNWQTTVGSPATVEDTGRLDTGGATTFGAGAEVISQAPSFGVVWISNNLPYIEFLETLDHMADATVTRVAAQFQSASL